MRLGVWAVTIVVLTGGLTLTPAPAEAAPTPVPLVVGLRSDADVLGDLPGHVDVLRSAPLPGALTVEVPSDQVTEVAAALRENPAVAYVEPDHTAYADVITPDDPGFAEQSGLVLTGVPAAWVTSRGSSQVVVAVVDTGVKALPDLKPRLLTGYDFVNSDTDADDDNGHGTQAAGIIAATAGNRIGIAGICWYCQILPVKVLGANGSGSYTDMAKGIRYAADRGADIINLSLGGTADSQLLTDAVDYAAAQGSLVIAAAGNKGSTVRHYPAAVESVLAVGGSTDSDTRYSWSNYSSDWVDLAAPGCNPAQDLAGVIGSFCGTSSATPFAAGVAALIAGITPAPSAATIRKALTTSARPLTGAWVAAGSGRVDAAAAVLTARALATDQTAPATSFRSPAASALVRGVVTVGARASDDTGVSKVVLMAGTRIVGTDTTSPYAFSWNTAAYRGPVFLTLRAYDRAGNVTANRLTVRVDNTAPSVLIAAARADSVLVTAQAADASGISRLDLLVNGRVVQRFAGVSHRFAIPVARYGKVVRVQVRAYDKAGNARLTPVRTFSR